MYATLATKPHLRGERLLDELEKKFTLVEQIEAERWLKSLSPEQKRMIAG